MNNIQLEILSQTAKAIEADPSLKMRDWHAKVTWKDGVQNEVQIRQFPSFLVDEPETLGGTDLAPNPVEYLIGAAASCFAITFEVLASQQGIQLEQVEVDITADFKCSSISWARKEGDSGIINPALQIKAATSASKEVVEQIARIALSKSPVLASLEKEIKLEIH